MRRICCVLIVLLLVLPLIAHAELGTVTASALVLRAGPGLEHDMLAEIPGGVEVEVLTYEDGWYYVSYDMQLGYVDARYVGLTGLDPGLVQQPQDMATPEPIPAGTMPPGLSLPELSFTGVNNPGYPGIMKPGDMGNSVIDLQLTLQKLGYTVNTDGQYGYDTQAAVMRMQLAMGIDADGIVGAQTRRLIGGSGTIDAVEKLDWWLGGSVAFARLTEATIVDVRTGQRFKINRYGGDNHCDVEPATKADTQKFLSILGGAWTWERRPVWLEVGGRVIAASMNCMPHEGQHIWTNDFDGHFCLHFYNSRTHETDRIDEEHAACVEEAWEKRGNYRTE